jgi:hypothetical protein
MTAGLSKVSRPFKVAGPRYLVLWTLALPMTLGESRNDGQQCTCFGVRAMSQKGYRCRPRLYLPLCHFFMVHLGKLLIFINIRGDTNKTYLLELL